MMIPFPPGIGCWSFRSIHWDFRNLEVPPVLLSGDHQAIARWREEQSLKRRRIAAQICYDLPVSRLTLIQPNI